MATVRGFVDVERLRADAPWYLEVPFCVDDLASGPMDVRFEPIDLDDRGRGAPFLLKRFCSDGVPTFEAPKRSEFLELSSCRSAPLELSADLRSFMVPSVEEQYRCIALPKMNLHP